MLKLLEGPAEARPRYAMTFFDLSYSGTILCVVSFGFMALALPCLSSSAAQAEPSESTDDKQTVLENFYTVDFFVRPGGGYVGMDPELARLQLKRLPGVKYIQAPRVPLEDNARLSCLVADVGVLSLRQIRGLRIANEATWQRCRESLIQISFELLPLKDPS